MSSPWVEPGTSCTTGSAMLDFDVELDLGVFRVGSRHELPKENPPVKRNMGKGKEPGKKRTKFAFVRDRSRDLVRRVVAILDLCIGLVLSVFRIVSRHQLPKGNPLVKRNTGKGKEPGKKRKKFALVRDRSRDLVSRAAAILDVGVGLVLSVFRVALQHQLPKLSRHEEHGKGERTKKKKKKICHKQGSIPGPGQLSVRHLGFVHWASFECFSRRLATSSTEREFSRQEERREGERTRKKRKKFALSRDRTRDLSPSHGRFFFASPTTEAGERKTRHHGGVNVVY